MTRTTVATLLLAAALLSGCAHEPSGRVYPRQQTNTAWTVEYGAVRQIQDITIEGERGSLGRIGGGFVGYETGRAIGSGTGSRIAGAAGAVAGAVAGHAVEKRVTQQKGYELTVEIEKGGKTIAVVQAADEQFAVGERVKILRRGDGAARVTKA